MRIHETSYSSNWLDVKSLYNFELEKKKMKNHEMDYIHLNYAFPSLTNSPFSSCNYILGCHNINLPLNSIFIQRESR